METFQPFENTRRKPPTSEVRASVVALIEEHSRSLWQAAGMNGLTPSEAFDLYQQEMRDRANKAERTAFQRGRAGLFPLRRAS